MKLDIVIPIFNEELGIIEFNEALNQELQKLNSSAQLDYNILYCLDPSTDNTENCLEHVCSKNKQIKVICFAGRSGHQNSILKGIELARKDSSVLVMDGDFQHPIELIPIMLDQLKDDIQIVQCKRNESQDPRLHIRLLSKYYYKALSSISGIKIESGLTDFKLMSPLVAKLVRENYMDQKPFLRAFIASLDLPTYTINFDAPQRRFGKTKFSTKTLIKFALSGAFSFSTLPLKIVSYIGFFLSIIAAIILTFTLIKYFTNEDYSPPGYTTLVILISILSGIQLLALGILGQYIGLIYQQILLRPKQLIRKIINGDY